MTGLSRKPAWLDSLQVHYDGLSIAYLYWSYLLLCIVEPEPQEARQGELDAARAQLGTSRRIWYLFGTCGTNLVLWRVNKSSCDSCAGAAIYCARRPRPGSAGLSCNHKEGRLSQQQASKLRSTVDASGASRAILKSRTKCFYDTFCGYFLTHQQNITRKASEQVHKQEDHTHAVK